MEKGTWKKRHEDEQIDMVKQIGTEEYFDEKGPLEKNSETSITFHVNMGDDKESLEALKHLLHCIGDPSAKQPYLLVKGSFNLSISSKKGWSWRNLGIEWMFVPNTQKQAEFMNMR